MRPASGPRGEEGTWDAWEAAANEQIRRRKRNQREITWTKKKAAADAAAMSIHSPAFLIVREPAATWASTTDSPSTGRGGRMPSWRR